MSAEGTSESNKEGLMSGNLVDLKSGKDGSLGGKVNTTGATNASSSNNVSRRRFLQILGSAPVVGAAAGCTDQNTQQVLPYVNRFDQQIVGESVWYNTTCTECSAGCGIQVRTAEGRAIKIEGNVANPINKGGVCAIGHSALQHLYDPDRVRQPLKRRADGKGFDPISWDQAIKEISQRLSDPDLSKRAFIDGGRASAITDLVTNFSKAFAIKRASFDFNPNVVEAKAAELVFGSKGLPTYVFDQADLVVNFGAGFLESWVSPVEYARAFAKAKRADHPVRLVHFEPRLSLTAANADHWYCNKPDSELSIALAILKLLNERRLGEALSEGVSSSISAIVSKLDLERLISQSGIEFSKLVTVVEYLAQAKNSLVLAGGVPTSGEKGLALAVVVNLINLLLGNVGKTIMLSGARAVGSSLDPLLELTQQMLKGQIQTLFIDGSNPVFKLPASFEISYALKRVETVVSFSSHMDESTVLAHYILPTNTTLESWGDVLALEGVYSLTQPVMKPVFDTRDLGEVLILIAKAAGKSEVAEGQSNFYNFVKARWQGFHAKLGLAIDFERFWLECLERGGYYEPRKDRIRVDVNNKAFEIVTQALKSEAVSIAGDAHSELVVYPFASVRSFDGGSANRPWMQEIPDPLSQTVWDAWAEIHPDTAKAKGLAAGDMINIKNYHGAVDLPIYLTPHLHKDVVAVPLGYGHTDYGRYAKEVGANVLSLIPKQVNNGTLGLLSVRASVTRGRGRSTLVNVQGSDSQLGRGLARTAALGAVAAHDGHDADHGSGHGSAHAGHHEPKQMYEQREHPLYKWGLSVDLASCTGCSACVAACYAENNIGIVGKKLMDQGRELSWLRIERYYDGSADEMSVSFLPMMCQHCGNAPCEPVCPVYATYHNEEGMNVMVYNRCVGTRYCSNNCSYKVRRFNWYELSYPEPLNWQLNPDVTPRVTGIMEKCTFCVQRILQAKDKAKDEGRMVRDGDVKPACVQSCPSEAMAFGNLNDPDSKVSKLAKSKRAYKVLDHHINTQPAVTYLENVKYKEA